MTILKKLVITNQPHTRQIMGSSDQQNVQQNNTKDMHVRTLVCSPEGGREQISPSSCKCSSAMQTEAPSSRTARLCLESSRSRSSSPKSTLDRCDATGLDGRVAAWERAGERSGELKALPISEAVSVLSLLGVGDGCDAAVMQTPPLRPSVRTDSGVFRASLRCTSFFSFSARTLRAIWLSSPPPTRPDRVRRLTFRLTLQQ